MISPSRSKTWQKLASHYLNLHHNGTSIGKLFENGPLRHEKFQAKMDGILLDYSKNLATDETIQLLCALADEAKLSEAITAMFSGEKINVSEDRAALHVALRTPLPEAAPEFNAAAAQSLAKMESFVCKIHSGAWTGHTGQAITHIVNIGIGGSDLGPAMVCAALQRWQRQQLKVSFVSNIDTSHLRQCLASLDPANTLFIVTSKSFSTLDTMHNARLARAWLQDSGCPAAGLEKHFVAVTSNIDKAVDFGIAKENIFAMWDWVGGRYSLWSAAGLSIALSIGMENFKALLNGARLADEHFRDTPFIQNIPVLMGLLSVWYGGLVGSVSQVNLPYSQELSMFPAFLQQLEMESLGKSIEIDGSRLLVASGPIVWGSAGTNAQHSFFQLLHQGTHYVPADFIAIITPPYPQDAEQHSLLLASCFSQSQALMLGKTQQEAFTELLAEGMDESEAYTLAKHKVIAGNKPSNTLLLDALTPQTLGSLIATYEHKVFVESVILRINAFDQWGVELGKQLGKKVYEALASNAQCTDFDPSTNGLINYCRNQHD